MSIGLPPSPGFPRIVDPPVKGVSELEARLDGLLEGELDWARFELDWARLGDTELVRDLGGEPIEFLEARRPLARLLYVGRINLSGEPD